MTNEDEAGSIMRSTDSRHGSMSCGLALHGACNKTAILIWLSGIARSSCKNVAAPLGVD